jgi:hypothetical protein
MMFDVGMDSCHGVGAATRLLISYMVLETSELLTSSLAGSACPYIYMQLHSFQNGMCRFFIEAKLI